MKERPRREAFKDLPRISPCLLKMFCWYVRRYVRKHFNAVRVSRASPFPTLGDEPLLIYMNHPSWWDPMIGLVIATEFLAERSHYAPIDEAELRRYRFFSRLGFFGVTPGSLRGARALLITGRHILLQPGAVLWLTPQGRFVDARERTLSFLPGTGNLARRMRRGLVLPIAVEYPFWEERHPEALVHFGKPIEADILFTYDASDVSRLLESKLLEVQEALAEEAVRRDPQDFEVVLLGRAGVGGIYDLWRRLRAWLHGKFFDPHHRRR